MISDTQLQSLRQELYDTKANEAKFLAGFRIETLADLPAREFDNAMAILADRRNRMAQQQKEAGKDRSWKRDAWPCAAVRRSPEYNYEQNAASLPRP